MPTKPSKKSINLKRWKILREEIIQERGCRCEVCGKTGKVDLHHIISRKHAELRFEKRNLVLLCPLHHKFGSLESAHNNPIWFFSWLEANRGFDLENLILYTKNNLK
jgi:5-methylcytosine-specific restriction endonuclease McrA